MKHERILIQLIFYEAKSLVGIRSRFARTGKAVLTHFLKSVKGFRLPITNVCSVLIYYVPCIFDKYTVLFTRRMFVFHVVSLHFYFSSCKCDRSLNSSCNINCFIIILQSSERFSICLFFLY